MEEPFVDGSASLVLPAGDAVLKIQWPHRESEHEAAALELWDGDGAVRLLVHDEERTLYFSSAVGPVRISASSTRMPGSEH